MKRIFKITLSLTMMLGLFSCEDYLTFTQYGEPSSDTFWSNEADVQSAVDGMYILGEESIGGRGQMYYYLCSDDLVYGRTHASSGNIKDFRYDDGCDVADIWELCYIIIKRANDILLYVPDAPVSDEVKADAISQAYFFRAWAYLWLAPCYGDNGDNGGIPIVTEETSVEDIDQPRAASVLDNYDMIISDLESAIDAGGLKKLSAMSTDDYGRPHLVAAWAYIAKAALYASQFDQSKYFPIVNEYCDYIIAQGERSLVQNQGTQASRVAGDEITYNDQDLGYRRLFSIGENYGTEYIFSIAGTNTGALGSNLGGIMIDNGGWGIQNTWGQFAPTVELYEAYEEDDIRRDISIRKLGDRFTFFGYDILYGSSLTDYDVFGVYGNTSGSFFCKYSQPFEAADAYEQGLVGTGTSSKLSTPLVRYAEVLLWKAEVAIWAGSSGDEWINQVRARVNLPAISGATKWDLIQERRSEFAGEYVNRMFDLIRWGEIDGVNVAEKFCEPALHVWEMDTSGTITTPQGWAARNYDPTVNHVWPIPAKYISESETLVQNKGY